VREERQGERRKDHQGALSSHPAGNLSGVAGIFLVNGEVGEVLCVIHLRTCGSTVVL
jgi:hypothetical protein